MKASGFVASTRKRIHPDGCRKPVGYANGDGYPAPVCRLPICHLPAHPKAARYRRAPFARIFRDPYKSLLTTPNSHALLLRKRECLRLTCRQMRFFALDQNGHREIAPSIEHIVGRLQRSATRRSHETSWVGYTRLSPSHEALPASVEREGPAKPEGEGPLALPRLFISLSARKISRRSRR